ncbi:MAG: hypothetical protein ABR520_03980 [Mycobacteriales bacterium]|nr:hypothetical protein [Frankia sp.]
MNDPDFGVGRDADGVALERPVPLDDENPAAFTAVVLGIFSVLLCSTIILKPTLRVMRMLMPAAAALGIISILRGIAGVNRAERGAPYGPLAKAGVVLGVVGDLAAPLLLALYRHV